MLNFDQLDKLKQFYQDPINKLKSGMVGLSQPSSPILVKNSVINHHFHHPILSPRITTLVVFAVKFYSVNVALSIFFVMNESYYHCNHRQRQYQHSIISLKLIIVVFLLFCLLQCFLLIFIIVIYLNKRSGHHAIHHLNIQHHI